jgi:hypothetical protein
VAKRPARNVNGNGDGGGGGGGDTKAMDVDDRGGAPLPTASEIKPALDADESDPRLNAIIAAYADVPPPLPVPGTDPLLSLRDEIRLDARRTQVRARLVSSPGLPHPIAHPLTGTGGSLLVCLSGC